jgi:1,2-diacylglycerol 3-alpha-glucosyltransferase
VKIVHLCVSCFYIDGRLYQENELVRQHVKDGHEVLVIASTENMDTKGQLTYDLPRSYMGADGAKVIRLPYRLFPHALAKKLRIHKGISRILTDFKPDAILFHGACSWEIGTVAAHVRLNPSVIFYIDSHEDHYNSARSFASRHILHRIYYRFSLSRGWRTARKILCVSRETINFVQSTYGVPVGHLELFPLGGHPLEDKEYVERRTRKRAELGIEDNEILVIQSGKQTKRKKLLETLRAFEKASSQTLKLVVAGTLADEIKSEALAYFSKLPNVSYLGWQTSEQVTDLLCAADVYLQPGTQSVTMQHSLCCRCAIILDDVPSHAVYHQDNGWLLNSNTDIETTLRALPTADLLQMKISSYRLACEMLDYKELANRVLR